MYVLPSVFLSVSPYVSLSGCLRRFLAIIRVARNCVQCMQPQATGSNTLSGSIICLSVCLVFHEPFAFFVFVLISSVVVQNRGAFIPILGSRLPQWGTVELVCLSLCISVSLYGCLHQFLVIKARSPEFCTAHAASVQRFKSPEWQYNMSVCPPVCPSVRPVICKPFSIFLFVLFSRVGVQRCDTFIPTLESGGHQWGPIKLIYLYVFLSVCMYVFLSVYMSGHLYRFLTIMKSRPVIACIACGRRQRVQIP